ncbi:hypothetical protein BP6252_10752 [Coleophoma cylindrospora]|uniref:Transcription factor domain-containing protein n=1 Tax=Coleophoma cylindrospora TaxID=1849047 RepID=A0A3D8QTT4_9HELO|nr:hypothetical protein BP6252_10752 [Coleophoma cylindrospora]
MPQLFAFVPTDGSARIRSPDRQLIRHHCMRRRNKQPGSRRSKREAAREASGYPGNLKKQDQHSIDGPQPNFTENRVVAHSTLSAQERSQAANQQGVVPPPPPSDWALFQFPDELDIFSQKLMHQYFIRNPIRDPLYPFKHFGILIDLDQDPLWCFRLLSSEPLCFRAILLLTSASNDLMLRRPLSNTTYRHLRRTLPILNSRLTKSDAHEHDIILYVVSILASIAILFGDYNAAKVHSAGLSEILRLRGGVGGVNSNPLMQLSIDRLNFSSLLITKLWTPIYNGGVWERPIFPTRILEFYHSQNMVCIDGLVDSDLATVFHNLQYTTILINTHYHNQTPIDGSLLRHCLGFVHSNLIELESKLEHELSECILWGMMAFLAATFRFPDVHQQPYNKILADKLQHSYNSAKASGADLPMTIDIWLNLVCLIASDNICDPYRCAGWKGTATGGLSWNETRRYLKEVMWIDAFHDELGRKAFSE